MRADIKQILSEAQHRWLRPAEICEILRNYQKFRITPEPPHKPASGYVFLFDRKALRYFRKDGHNWSKKKDGKTAKEAHEKLKVGSIDVLDCYYAHGEENENFQRRCYWMLEQDLKHIVFVHYLEVKGNKANIHNIKDTKTMSSNSQNDSSFLSSSPGNNPSVEHVPLSDGHGAGDPSFSNFVFGDHQTLNLASWEEILGLCTTGVIPDEHKPWNPSENQGSWQGDYSLCMPGPPSNQGLMPGSAYCGKGSFQDQRAIPAILQNVADPFYLRPEGQEVELVERSIQKLHANAEAGYVMNDKVENGIPSVGAGNCSLVLKQSHLSGIQADESLKKVDSFSRWMDEELGEVEELHLLSSNGYSWRALQTEDVVGDFCTLSQLQLDTDSLNFSLSQDQLFSITEFSPTWAHSSLETKVIITGRFLKSGEEFADCKWSCMFGELEVPAEVSSEGVLCCLAPPHKAGLVPFYVTCSNRLACSEVREFEYRAGPSQKIDFRHIPEGDSFEVHLQKRLQNLLLMGAMKSNPSSSENIVEKKEIVNKINSLMEAESNQMATYLLRKDTCQRKLTGEQEVENLLKEKFFSWLLQKVTEEGKGSSVVDDEGQGILHLAAALSFNWALKPIIFSGVSIDIRDVNGWTALHWAALCGREDTVAALVSLGAAPGALTDPSGEYPLGRTPADLASANGHKGISGFLAECSLTQHLSTLTVKDLKEDTLEYSGSKAIQTVSERVASPITEDVPESLSLKDSLAAVRNAAQAAGRIHQIYRIQSLQRKQFDQDSDESTVDEHALSLVAAKTGRLGKHDGTANAAAIRIQRKYRGWKKRKEFLLIRQGIVKIQAHVRGHQVRKKNKSIVWSVGILEKIILRWRHKGSGLRGFHPDAVAKCPGTHVVPQKEDDYDFLKEGRKQTEERMQKALARVKSMAQYPEARAQYRRLLTVAEGFRESERETASMILKGSEEMSYPDEELLDIEHMWDDDTFMSIEFE